MVLVIYMQVSSTYKSRSEDFKKLFTDIPGEERLIAGVSTSCGEKRKRSDSILCQKPQHPQTNPKRNPTSQKRHQTPRLHNHCGPT